MVHFLVKLIASNRPIRQRIQKDKNTHGELVTFLFDNPPERQRISFGRFFLPVSGRKKGEKGHGTFGVTTLVVASLEKSLSPVGRVRGWKSLKEFLANMKRTRQQKRGGGTCGYVLPR